MAKKRTKTPGERQGILSSGRKRVLVVLFIPSVERDGTSAIDQVLWVDSALEMFGRVFGGEDDRNLAALGDFCRKLGREARQGEIGLVVGDEYFAVRDFSEGGPT